MFPILCKVCLSESGWSLMTCQAVRPECSLLETAFLCLATVSTVTLCHKSSRYHLLSSQISLLTTVLNSTPIIPEDSSEDISLLLKDNSQCVIFALFMIWFASITVNLGPTFLRSVLCVLHRLMPSNHFPQRRTSGQL